MILLDTCTFIWDALQPGKLSKKATGLIELGEGNNQLHICDITLWEVARLVKKGKVEIDSTAALFNQLALQARNIQVQPITSDIAELAVSLDSSVNKDPADRIIAATCIIQNATLITADTNLRKSPLLEAVW